MDEKEKNLLSIIRDLAISKQLNILFGSGVSKPANPLMNEVNGENEEEKNKELIKQIKKVNKDLIDRKKTKSDSISKTLDNYRNFIFQVLNLLNISNSRQTPRSVNIFTTNYDLFIEKAVDELLEDNRFIFNDGANGYFDRYLDSSNYNKVVSYKGLNDNYINELPTINLIKPHGSVNWEKDNDKILVTNHVVKDCVVVKPNGLEEQDTFLNNHFHEMLRLFQLELDKPQTLLLVIGFSFQDKHIAKMFKRALQNSEFFAIIFCYSDKDEKTIKNNLKINSCSKNFKILTPSVFSNSGDTKDILVKEHDENGVEYLHFDITSLTKIFEGDGYGW